MIKLKNTKKIKVATQLQILNEILIFLNNGHNVIFSLETVLEKYNLSSQLKILNNGEQLVNIFRNLNFNNDILLIIEISESSNSFKEGIYKSKLILESKIEFKNNIVNLLKYPILILTIAIGSLLFLSNILLPQFMELFNSMNIELNYMYLLMIDVIYLLPNFLLFIFVLLIIFIIVYKYLDNNNKINVLLKIPVIRKYYKALYNFIFISNLYNLLSINVTLDKIFTILSNQNYNSFLSLQSNLILENLLNGYELSETLDKQIYNKQLIDVIKDGEKYNNLKENLNGFLNYLTIKQQSRNKNLLFIIQPIIYLIFGLLIILMYSAIFIPMYEMMNQL